MATSKPDMTQIWAAAGTSVKPADSKIQEGWSAEKPPFQTENWIQNRTDQYLLHLDERGVPEWDNASAYENGALCWYLNQIWESLTFPNNGNIPVDGQGFWKSQDYLDRRGDTMAGLIQLLQGLQINQVSGQSNSATIRWNSGGIIRATIGRAFNNTDFIISLIGAGGGPATELRLTEAGVLTVSGSLVWCASNDGPGSGLNADLLDGYQASDFFSALGNRAEYTTPGSYSLTIPNSVNMVHVSLSGAGQAGSGGGDGGNCGTGATPSPGLPSWVNGSLQQITVWGGADSRGATIITPSSSDENIISSMKNPGLAGPNGNPAPGGNGGSNLHGAGGIGDTRFGGPYPEWNGTRGGGGSGGGGQDSLPGNGGESGSAIHAVPFSVIPGETLTVVVQAGGLGTSGCRSTGGKGGDGYASIEW